MTKPLASPQAEKFARAAQAAREGGPASADPPADPRARPPRRAPALHPLFALRWERALRDLRGPIARLYGAAHDADALMGRIQALLYAHWRARPADLRALDIERDVDPDWFLSQEMVGYVAYADRFAGTLRDLPETIPWLKGLGVTYLHLMPLLQPRPGDSDGGYAVIDYRAVDPRLGTADDLEALARALRAEGISLCLDLVLNHAAREHPWAEAARAGDPFHRAFFRIFPDDALPKAHEATLVDIFPDQAPGSFTLDSEMGEWVWTTFNAFQWDLNWENPEVFLAFLDIVLLWANRGVEVFRLDAVAFMGKRLGTTCQNLPEVHDILQALTAATRAAAPAVIQKAEAIVGPRDLVPYLGTGARAGRASQLAYHNSLMVQFWSALASRDARLMAHVLRTHFPEGFRRASFATYLRNHDDIGWAVTEEDAAAVPHLDAPAHRAFLADFYNGTFPGSFARGADFQANPRTGDRRTNGTLASLAGLEAAGEAGDEEATDRAIARILLGHALIASHGGLPLLYMGDEIGLLNDRSYGDDPDRGRDGRWLHRPAMDWTLAVRALQDPDLPAARILAGVRAIMAARKALPALAAWVPTRVLDAGPALLALARPADEGLLVALFNLAEAPQAADPAALGLAPGPLLDRLSGEAVEPEGGRLALPPYAALWLTAPP